MPGWYTHSASFQDVGAHTLGFVRFERAGVRLLLRYAYFRESIKNGFTLHFQLTR